MASGGRRPGAGRKPGSPNRKRRVGAAARIEVTALAKTYTEMALRTLAEIAEGGQSEAARVSAASALLDRGWGRPTQATEVTGKDGAPFVLEIVRFADKAAGE